MNILCKRNYICAEGYREQRIWNTVLVSDGSLHIHEYARDGQQSVKIIS